ncbi:MAG: DUF2946 domain-containing protein [Burkholderiales bacterium]|nr:MAG: DUF2946 domain-containing protein [Burkholderiales bacterium]
MPFTVRQRARIVWIALVAMLMSTLAPSVSHAAMASAAGVPWGGGLGEICTVDGVGPVSTAQAQSSTRPAQSGPEALRFEHCPDCLSQAGSAAPPAPPHTPGLPTAAAAPLPWLFLHAPEPLYPWLAAQPRAPPARS